jgi:hypothetical protein
VEHVRFRRWIPDGPTIRTLDRGTELEVVRVQNTDTTEWLHVFCEKTGEIGYVASRFIDWSRTVPTIPQPRPLPPPIPDNDDFCLPIGGKSALNTASLVVLISGALLCAFALIIVAVF